MLSVSSISIPHFSVKSQHFQLYDFIVQLKMVAFDGKMRDTDAADTEHILRLIQSIPSPKAEPFKMWLSKVGYERIEETEDPGNKMGPDPNNLPGFRTP